MGGGHASHPVPFVPLSLLADDLSLALEDLEQVLAENDVPPLLEWPANSGRSFPCVPNPLGLANDLVEGGFSDRRTLIVFVRKDSFLQPITADTTRLTADSDHVTADHSGSTLQFGAQLTADSAEVTADSTAVTADHSQKPPDIGNLVGYQNRTWRVLDRRDLFGCFRYALQSPDR